MSRFRTLPPLSMLAIACLLPQAPTLRAGEVSPAPVGQGLQAPPSRPPVVGEGRAAISGLVRDAVTRRPVAGAIVTLTPMSGNRVGPGAKQLTDASGQFVFADLEAGDGYLVGASRFGFFNGGFGRKDATGNTRRIALADDEWFSTATIDLWREAAVNGTVLDEAGDPVVGAHVRVMADILVAGEPRVVAGPQGRTDDRGQYRIGGLAPGRYFVSVPSVQMTVPASASKLTLSGLTPAEVSAAEAAGRTVAWRRDAALPVDPVNRLIVGHYPSPPGSSDNQPRAYPTIYAPSARTLAETLPIALDYGDDRRGVDVRLTPVRASRIAGVVAGPPEGVANLTLRLMARGDEDLGLGSEVATALVAGDATFTFLNVPAGAYTILASRAISEYTLGGAGAIATSDLPLPPAMVTSGMSGTAVVAGPPGTGFTTRTFGPTDLSGRTEVEVASRDVTDVVVQMERGASLRGRLVIERAATAGPAGAASIARIRAEPAGGEAALSQPSARRGADDPLSFVIEGLGRGQYLVRVPGAMIKSIAWNGRDYTDRPFDTSSGASIDDVVVTTTDRAASMTGSVRDERGQTASSGAVIYFPVEPALWRRYGLQPARLRSVQVSSAGTFNIARVPAGEYYLIAVTEDQGGRWTDPAFLEVASRLASRVSVDWGGTATQNLSLASVK